MVRLLSLTFLAACILLIGTACASKDPEKLPLEVDALYSVNVVGVPSYWPREKLDWPLEEPQRSLHKEAHGIHGNPDYIRFVYTFDDRFIRPSELEENHRMIGKRPAPMTEWVYIEQDKVLRFESNRYVEKPLTEELRMVCTHGDPTQVKEVREPDGTLRRIYTYLDLGKEFVYYDGKLSTTRDFTPAPGFQTRF
jgi:hypothetical protein